MKPIEPNLNTPDADLCKEELNKINSAFLTGTLDEDFHDMSTDHIIWESEQLAKCHGIYLEFNRAKTGKDKDWMYMIRITIPGGGPITPKQWKILDEISDAYTVDPDGKPSIRLTTRQNIQYHWIKHQDLVKLVNKVATTGFLTLNGCGDNVRNVMGGSRAHTAPLFDSNALAQKIGKYFQLPPDPHIKVFEIDTSYVREAEGEQYQYSKRLLNRKFKIGVCGVEKDPETGKYVVDNSVEMGTNDLGVVPIIENDQVTKFQVYVGGGQGEKNGKPVMAMLSKPLGIFTEENLMKGLDAIVKVHEETGDRQNRFWARLKNTIHYKGIPWYQEQIRAKGAIFEEPIEDLDLGIRALYHGWYEQPDGLWSYGAFIECGRLIDGSPNGDLKSMAKHIMATYDIQVVITPNQDLLFLNIPADKKETFEADLAKFGYGKRNGKEYSTLRKTSVACVGLPTCRLAYTDSERFIPELMDELESRGYGDIKESVGISGCERQCSRPGTKAIGLVGGGKNLYRLKLLGTEDGLCQGTPLIEDDLMYLSTLPREEVANVISILFDWYKSEKEGSEDLGRFLQRKGISEIIAFLKEQEATAPLMEKTRKVV